MKIALSGAQGVGKTTILNKMIEDPYFKNYEISKEAIRNLVKEFNIGINKLGNNESQLLIANAHYQNTFKGPQFITDRWLLDCFVFTTRMFQDKQIDQWVYDYNLQLLKSKADEYDFVFYFPPEFDLVDDNFRSLDKNYQTELHELFETIIDKLKLKHIRYITGTIEERYNKIKTIINEEI
jgi:nicotinamide riboside kinase